MISQLSPYLSYYPYLLGILFFTSLLLLLIASYNLWRQRTAAMWRHRHDAGRLGSRLLFVSISMLGTVTVVSVFSGVVIYSFGYEDEFFPPRNPYGVQGVAISSLPTPTEERPTLPPMTTTPTPTLERPTIPPITDTPTPNPLATLGISLPEADRTPDPNAEMRIVAVSNQEDDASVAQTSRTLTWGTDEVFFWVEHTNINEGVIWSPVLYHDSIPIQASVHTWQFGENGMESFQFSSRGGFAPGRYEIRLYLAEEFVDAYTFAIVDRDS